MNREKEVYKVTLWGSVVNLVLVVFKFAAGVFGHSSAMIADAFHSLRIIYNRQDKKSRIIRKPIIRHYAQCALALFQSVKKY